MSAVHTLPVRIYYEDTDAAGIVYYPNYLRFAERARTEFLRDIGFDHIRLAREERMHFVVRSCAVDYLRPARLDDALTVETHISAIAGARLDLRQIVTRDAETLVEIDIRLACMGPDGRPVRLPAALRQQFERLSKQEEAV